MNMTTLQRKLTFAEVFPFSAGTPGGEGAREEECLLKVKLVGTITSLIKWRHSEKCFSLDAAIHFLVLICALWQGFVKGNNEQLYQLPPSPIVVAPVRRLRG